MVIEKQVNAPKKRFRMMLVGLWATALTMALMAASTPSYTEETPVLEEATKSRVNQGFIAPINPKSYAHQIAEAEFGWDTPEHKCLNALWGKESAWDYQAKSPTYDYGIPQRHMKTSTKKQIDNFMKNPFQQIEWGLNYIKVRYGSPCNAWSFWQENRWY